MNEAILDLLLVCLAVLKIWCEVVGVLFMVDKNSYHHLTTHHSSLAGDVKVFLSLA